jgi:4-carboxymuconolactone decarboxylase
MVRVPYLQRKDLPENLHHYYDKISNKRDFFPRPFSVLLHQPEAAARVAQLGSYVRFESSLTDEIREIIILTTAREMNSVYEFTHHVHIAKGFGVSDDVIDSIRKKTSPKGLTTEQAVFVNFTQELLSSGKVSDDLYKAIEHLVGKEGIIDVGLTTTYYRLLASLMNIFEVDLEPDQEPLLP